MILLKGILRVSGWFLDINGERRDFDVSGHEALNYALHDAPKNATSEQIFTVNDVKLSYSGDDCRFYLDGDPNMPQIIRENATITLFNPRDEYHTEVPANFADNGLTFEEFYPYAKKELDRLREQASINGGAAVNARPAETSSDHKYFAISDIVSVNAISEIEKLAIYRNDGKPLYVWEKPTRFSTNTQVFSEMKLANMNFTDGSLLVPYSCTREAKGVKSVVPKEESENMTPYYNRLQASEEWSPLVFKLDKSYRFGVSSNKVFDIHPVTDLIPDTRFGDNPFYVFCDDGIWLTTKSGADILIDSYFNFSDLFAPNRKSIVQTDIGLVFATKNDVYVMNGRQMQKISNNLTVKQLSKMSPKFFDESGAEIADPNKRFLANMLWDAENKRLNDYFSIFDDVNNEMNFIDCDNEVSFCFNTETGQWTSKKFTTQFASAGKVLWSNLFWSVLNGAITLNDLSTDNQEASQADITIRSRPIFTNATRIERILNIIAGRTNNFVENADNDYILQNGAKIRIYTSVDGLNFNLSADNRFIDHTEGVNGRLNASAMYYIIEVVGTFNWLVFTGIFLQEKTKITQTQEVNIR
jgi:hypothetical protein